MDIQKSLESMSISTNEEKYMQVNPFFNLFIACILCMLIHQIYNNDMIHSVYKMFTILASNNAIFTNRFV